jgi:hypothetical protein
MIDNTMFEVLWRNISDFYVNLRVEVVAVSRNRYGVEKTADIQNKGNNKITELRTILQRESQNS